MPGLGFSGYQGDCKIGGVQISEIKKWGFTPRSLNQSYASNKTGGFKRRVPGVQEGSGTIEGVWDPTNPITSQIAQGSVVTLQLYHDPVAFWTVPAVIDELKVDVDLDTGAIVAWSATFGTNGGWTAPSVGMKAVRPDGAEGEGEAEVAASPIEDLDAKIAAAIAAAAPTFVAEATKSAVDAMRELLKEVLAAKAV